MSRDPLAVIFEALDRTRHLEDDQIDQMIPTANLLAQIHGATQQPLRKSLKNRFWRRGVVISTVAVLVIGSAAAAITLSRRPVETVAHMTCYQRDSMRSTADVVSYDANSLAVCSQVMHWPADSVNGAGRKGTLCLLSDGSLAAFPPSHKRVECSALGLVAFNGGLANPEVARFQALAESYFTRHPCQSVIHAQREILQLLGRYGLSRWKLRSSGLNSPSACATLAFQPKSMVVDIVGIQRQGSKTP
jgi:hypothetical protein